MLAIFVRNGKIIQSTGMSFAALGTTMHVLNVANMMTPTISHTWSAIAIAGFFMTASSQIVKGFVKRIPMVNKQTSNAALSSGVRNDDVALP